MRLYLAGEHCVKNGKKIKTWSKLSILESYYYARDNKYFQELLSTANLMDFLLDSGAYTFMNNATSKTINWTKYVEQYAAFINKYNIKQFFELDIDSLVGLEQVEQLRNQLENQTGKKSIPVWHKSRGLDYYHKMVKEYEYVAIGGIVNKEIKKQHYGIFHKLLKIARENKCKVHGLGFTPTKGLNKYKFYSVDSTAWLYGNLGGYVYHFKNGIMNKTMVPNGKKLKSQMVAQHNFNQWIKYQQYAKINF